MRGQDEQGRESRAGRPGAGALGGRLADASDDQIRGVFARLMRTAGLPAGRAAGVLRVGRSTYFGYLGQALPSGFAEPGRAEPEDEAEDD